MSGFHATPRELTSLRREIAREVLRDRDTGCVMFNTFLKAASLDAASFAALRGKLTKKERKLLDHMVRPLEARTAAPKEDP